MLESDLDVVDLVDDQPLRVTEPNLQGPLGGGDTALAEEVDDVR